MRLEDFLKIICALKERGVVKLFVPALHHMRNNLRVFWILHVSAVVQSFVGAC